VESPASQGDVAERLQRVETTLLEVVTALGMLVGELALQDNLVLTKAAEVEGALEKGWAVLFGGVVDRSDLRSEAPSGAVVVDVDPLLDANRVGRAAGPVFLQAMRDIDASVGALYEVEGSEVVLVEYSGYPAEVMEQFARFPVDADLPAAAVALSGRPMWFDERAAILETYPDLKDAHERTEAAIGREGIQGAVIPVQVGDSQLVMLFGFTTGDRRSAGERELSALAARFARRLEEARSG
jgi:hypothetical protein